MDYDSDILEGIPKKILPEEIFSSYNIEGGLNNRNILINNSILIKNYLPRDEKNDPVYLRYLREKEALLTLGQFSYAPKLFQYHETDNKLYISRDWIEGVTLTQNELEIHLEDLVSSLISLHSNTHTSNGDYNYFDVIERYLREYKHLNLN